jgi:hypothetical protein
MTMRTLWISFLLVIQADLSFAVQAVAPGQALPIAGCITPPAPGFLITFQSTVAEPSGGHEVANHNNFGPRPKGSFNSANGPSIADAYTDINGCANINWYAPIHAGFYDIVAFGAYGSDAINIISWINVEIGQPLIEMLPSSDYMLVGMKPPHPKNHFGTASTVASLQYIMSLFKQQTGHTGHVNDLSLMWGGKFDFHIPDSNYGCWAATNCGHEEHRRGRNADIPFSGLGGFNSIFFSIATQHGGASGAGGIVIHSNHYHLRFQY